MSKKETKFSKKIEYDENFLKIINFYLFECPVEDASHRGKTFKEIGWKNSSNLKMLERLLKEISEIDDENWNIYDSISEVEEKSKNMDLKKQFICSDRSKGKVKTIIYSIRCSLAHGSFETRMRNKERYYYFENEYRGRMRSKIFIKEETLFQWEKIIKAKPEHYKKVSKKR